MLQSILTFWNMPLQGKHLILTITVIALLFLLYHGYYFLRFKKAKKTYKQLTKEAEQVNAQLDKELEETSWHTQSIKRERNNLHIFPEDKSKIH